jgi:hypothetical protein
MYFSKTTIIILRTYFFPNWPFLWMRKCVTNYEYRAKLCNLSRPLIKRVLNKNWDPLTFHLNSSFGLWILHNLLLSPPVLYTFH